MATINLFLASSCCISSSFSKYSLPKKLLFVRNFDAKFSRLTFNPKTYYSPEIGIFGKPKKLSKRVAVRASQAAVASTVQIADALFTFATASVMPIYSAMLFAPGKPLTRKMAESSIPFFLLGSIYIYLFWLSFTPDTLSLMFASKYWLPELSGITKMFSSTLTVASAWLHLIVVDLYSARHVYLDGLKNDVSTQHSLVLCLMFGPIGIMCHSLTTWAVQLWRQHQPPSDVQNISM